MGDPKKGLAIAILAKAKPKPEEGAESEGSMKAADDAGAETAAEELMAAIKAGDAGALLEAFRSLKELC